MTKRLLTKTVVAAIVVALGSPLVAQPQDWETHVVADRFTDERSLVSTKIYDGSGYHVQAQIICNPSKSFSYTFALLSDSGVQFESNLLGLTSFRVRLDNGQALNGVALQARREQTSATISISSDDLIKDYHDSVRIVAGSRISNKNLSDWQVLVDKYSIPVAPNDAIIMGTIARRIRFSFETTAGDAVIDIDQESPGPASVLKMCGLSRQKFVAEVNDTETKAVEALRQLAAIRQKNEAAQEAKTAEDEKYDVSNWPANSGPSVEGACRVSVGGAQYQSGCYVISNNERFDLYPIATEPDLQQIPRVQLRVLGDEAFGIVDVPSASSSRTGVLTRSGNCWTSNQFVICAELPTRPWH